MSRSLLNRVWYQLWRRLLKLIAVFVYRVRYSGQENIPATGGVLGRVESSEPFRPAAGRHRLDAADELRRPPHACSTSGRSAGF